jgi:predicted ATPase
VIAEVCRKLDGIPLAIELAASTVGVLGVDEMRRELEERLSLFGAERRTTIPRHRSMSATLAWGYNVLKNEKAVPRRLASFRTDLHWMLRLGLLVMTR